MPLNYQVLSVPLSSVHIHRIIIANDLEDEQWSVLFEEQLRYITIYKGMDYFRLSFIVVQRRFTEFEMYG